MNRILVIRGGAIGDFVLTLPAIELLRNNFPQAHLEFLGYRHIAVLAENRFYAQATRSIEAGSLARFFARDVELPTELSAYFRSFDLVVSYLFDPDQIFEQNLRRCGAENFLACSPKIAGTIHAARQLGQPLQRLGLSLGDLAARLYPSPEDREFARGFLRPNPRPMIAVHPGSGSESKNWPASNWLQIMEWLLTSRHAAASLLVIGGEADAKQLATLRSAVSNAAVQFVENLPLPQLAACMENCALFLGHDSGISHIAAAVGAPCVLLFGPSDPAVWAPTNAEVVVMRASSGAMSDLLVDQVKEAVRSRVSPNDSTS